MAEKKLLEVAIEPRDGLWQVSQWSIMGSGSVLEGTNQKEFLDDFETKEEAIAAYPKAEVYAGWVAADQLPLEPPAGYYGSDGGFYDAGEYWSEEDY